MLGLIVVVIVLIATIVLAIFGSKVWHWAHVLVVVGLVFSTLGYSNLGYRVLEYRNKHQKTERDALARLEQEQELIQAINTGSVNPSVVNRLAEPLGLGEGAEEFPSIGELEYELELIGRVRGRLWENVKPLAKPDGNHIVTVGAHESAPPLSIKQGAILYVFEQGDPGQGASYIGEFRVTEAQPKQLQLEPVLSMDGWEDERFSESASAGKLWTLHETMPVDTHEMFEGLTEEQLRAMLPEASVEEYIRDGSDPRPDDDQFRIMGIDEEGRLVGPEEMQPDQKKVYVRKLRDYAYQFQEYAKRRRELLAERDVITNNTKLLREAHNLAKKVEAVTNDENRRLKIDKAGVTKELQAAQAHLAALSRQLEMAKKLLDATLAANAQAAQQLAGFHAAIAGSPDLSSEPTPAKAAGDPHAL